MLRATVESRYPLSPMQQGMLFHSLYARQPGVDIEQILVGLPETMDAAAFARAWQCATDRHDILRTSFHWQEQDEPCQQVHPHVEVRLVQADWRDLSSAGQQQRLEEFLEADRRRSFDLTSAPMFRLVLIRLAEAQYQFVLTFHHLLLDGRAIALLLQDAFELYEAFQTGQELELPAPPQYRNYLDWLQRQDWSKAEAFWRETLRDFEAPTPLIAAGNLDAPQEDAEIRAEQGVQFDDVVTASLAALAAKNRITLNTVVQGAWALLLSRYSGEEDVCYGVIRAGRRPAVEGAKDIVGLFINTVPLRVRIVPDMTVASWLQQVRNQWSALRDYEHTPLVKIQSWSQVPRGQPLFETVFNYQDPGWDAALRALGGKWANRQFGIRSLPNYPLAVDAYGGDALLIKLLYHRNRFDDATITRMLGHLKTLLEAMANDPGQKLADVPLLTESERHQLLVEWNDTDADFPKEKCVHELFEAQAARTPDALAVADDWQQLTYRGLNDRADELARRLRMLGVEPDARVGVAMSRSPEMIVAWLAVLKAGGAFVPLDPAAPQERLAFMLKDAGVAVLLTQKPVDGESQFHGAGIKLLCVDGPPQASDGSPDEVPSETKIRAPHSRDLAYVIYTSGSTGEPKGVEIEHASLVNLIAWHQRTYRVTLADRATQLAAPVFDASIWEVWPYLTAGASIHIPDEETRITPAKLQAWLVAQRITLTFIPTPLAEVLLDEPWPAGCALRAVLTGGDRLHRPPATNFPCALFNHYGPTENAVVTTWTAVPPAIHQIAPPPIGRPLSNAQVYLLDARLQPVPVGVTGELHIGGASLARGYLNRPDLTTEKFIPNPFSNDPRSRLYQTGDLVRWLPDGNIEFLGRRDHQVKVRGNRIELGEIESALARHPAIREAVVVARADDGREPRLVAYVVPAAGQSATANELRDFLRQRLPDAMLPAAVVFLPTLPLTTNGKVDRKALPAPEADIGTAAEFVAPRTATEEKLAGIWCEVLGLKRAGIHDNFFELGGHSLLATQVISRVRSALLVELPLHELFAAPTIASLAAKIETTSRSAVADARNPIVHIERMGEQPLSFAQERLWFLEQLEPGLPVNNIPIALRLEGSLNAAALEQALNEIVRRHATLRTAFRNQNGRPAAMAEPARWFTLPLLDLSKLSPTERDAEAHRHITEEAQRPFNLTRSPLLRAKLLRLAADEHVLLLVTHHIACDGWSLGLFYRELAALYETFVHGRTSPLPELPVDYADFAQWQRERLQGPVLDEQLAYWKQQISGAQTALGVPTDHPRPPLQTYRGATKCLALPADLSAGLQRLSRQEDATLFMVLLAAWQTLLHRYSGQDDILVGSPIAGRTRVETENLIGFFLNTLVFRGDLSGDPTFRELLKRVRQTALGAYAHQDLPFEQLVDALQLERDLSRSPLFQAMFVLQNEPLRPLELAGLKLQPVQVHSGTAKFDLLLSLEESAEGICGFLEYNTDLFDEATIARMLGHYQTLLEGIVADPEQPLSALPLLTAAERTQQLAEWNATRAEFPIQKCVHELFQEQVERTPNAVALVFQDEELTYRELNRRADRLAEELRGLGVGPEVRVGLCVERSLEMMVSLLGILKAGGCYVPLDPTYPKDRLAFMLEDSQAPVLLTEEALRAEFNFEIPGLKVLCLDAARDAVQNVPDVSHSPHRFAHSDNLAYVLYTSGSTGKPKGVMVTHRNVVNFFTGMDEVLGTQPGVWLAVTSISFDISVLELFWTLTRGYKVVIHREEGTELALPRSVTPARKKIDFSLFYFGSDADEGAASKYRLLIEGAKFADRNGFAAVWTPERHFHQVGGLYPNPSLTSAALAMITERMQIRAGSVVLPLHNPLRVAEEWSVVDNLSNGRAAISFASGWHANDFAMASDNYSRRKEVMFQGIETVRRLWRGEAIPATSGSGQPIEVRVFPRPIQSELPMWLTSSGNAETFRMAGELGLNVLTHLFGQGVGDLAKHIATYRAAWRKQGHPGEGHVSIMLHTFVWDDSGEAWEKVCGPLCNYLRSYRDLSRTANQANGQPARAATEAEIELLLRNAAERYFESSGLFGTPERALAMVEQLSAIGMDELACLIDFGIDAESILSSLRHLNQLREQSNRPVLGGPRHNLETGQWRSVPEQILRHGVTHMQCTPSLAGALVLASASLEAMRRLNTLLLGGEALPPSLAEQLRTTLGGQLINMYGPTETTVWSATHRVSKVNGTVPIGRPIANTEIYLFDKLLQPVPAGVPGELFIGGEGVARGYLNRPELTAERFIRHPFSPDADARLYRTGDLARYHADGTIEFLGRLDHQVKLRGHRVELGEIESALRRHSDVRECVVQVWEVSPGDKRLVAYFVPANGTKPPAGELRGHLQPELPDYMIPSAFVPLDELPLTPNGKVDRKALTRPEELQTERETAYVAPTTGAEKTVAKVWEELLHVEKVGLNDNFFDLGGHSLLVVQAQVKLRDALGVDLPVVRLFQYPTVNALARFLTERTEQQTPLKKVQDRAQRQRKAFARRREEEVAV